MRNEALLEELTQAFGVAGFEGEVREIIRREAQPYADEIREDAMGNLIVLTARIRSALCLRHIWTRLVSWSRRSCRTGRC